MATLKPRFILLAVLATLALHLSLPLLLAQEPTPAPTFTPARNTLLVADAFVRGGPGESYVPVGRVVPTMALIALNISPDGGWVLIRYNNAYGWIRRDLAFWAVNVDALPVLEANLTPTPSFITNTPFFPTGTPTADYVAVNAVSALVRGGPGRTYLRLGQLYPGDALEAVGRNSDTSWILIRFGDEGGFGWVRRDLGVWFSDLELLPILTENRLTPTLTFTPSITHTPSSTPSETLTATSTPTITPTLTHTDTITPTHTVTASPTATDTPSPTDEPSATPTDTATDEPTATVTPAPTDTATALPTETATDEPTLTVTPEPTATATQIPTETGTDAPTLTATPEPSITPEIRATEANVIVAGTDAPTLTETVEPTVTATEEPTVEPTNTSTDAPTSTITPEPSATYTEIPPTETATDAPTQETPVATETEPPATSTESPTDEATQIAAVITVTAIPPSPEPISPTPSPSGDNTPATDDGLAAEAFAAGVIFLGIIAYLVAYLRGTASAKRYATGFIIDTCPICREGQLAVESRTERSLGIPNTRHLVKCNNCRSLLREIGGGRWRYAVDRSANPVLYDRLNNREVREDTIQRLLEAPPDAPTARVVPGFTDDESDT